MIVRFIAIVLILLFGFAAVLAVPSSRSPAGGNFVDGDGATHHWQINDSHCLIWDDKPYLPVGAVFQSKFLSGVTTDTSWHDDLEQLAQFKRHHVMSLLVEPMGPPGSLLQTLPSAVQAIVDILDSEGFTYGFALEGCPTKTWDAAYVHPSVYRDPAPPVGATVFFRNIPGLYSADYYLVGAQDGSILEQGSADIDDDAASVKLPPDSGGENTVLLLYPVCQMTPSLESTRIPDLWSGGDDYRDAMLLYFSRIRFGKGLRFFLDPVRVDASLIATTEGGIIPEDDDFRLRFQTWLLKRYFNSRVELDKQWAIKNDDLTDFAVAARCRPLWYQEKGLGLLFDPVTDKTYETLPGTSAVWADIRQFEIESIQSSMNDIADAVKQGIANVPVIYRWTQVSPAFVNNGPGGFDGLWVSPTKHGPQMVPTSAGYAFAAVEQARKKQWFLAGLSAVVDAGSSGPPAGRDDAAKGAYALDRMTLDSIGVKGEYVAPPDDAQWTTGESRWLDWVNADQTARDATGTGFVSSKPIVLFYPTNVALDGASIQSLGDGVWWLPTFQTGTLLDLGSNLEGYSLADSSDTPSYVVYATGSATVASKFHFPPVPNIAAATPSGDPVPLPDKRGYTTINFTRSPIIITGVSDIPLPQGAADDEMALADQLIANGTLSNVPVETYSQRLYYIKSNLMVDPNHDERVAYENVRYLISELQSVLSPFVWIEGEATSNNSFEGVVESDTASEHAFLWIDTAREPPGGYQGGYKASYTFSVSASAAYTVWAAIAPGAPGTTGVSPITVTTDMAPSADVSLPKTEGPPYGRLSVPTPPGSRGGFTWCELGTAQLATGSHTLTIALSGRAPGTDRYTLGIDALCITRVNFHPDGIRKPNLANQTIPSLVPREPQTPGKRPPRNDQE